MGMATCERNNVLYIRCNNQPVLRVYVFVFISLLLQLPLLFIKIFGFGIVFNIREKKCIPIFCRCVLRFFFRKMIEIVLYNNVLLSCFPVPKIALFWDGMKQITYEIQNNIFLTLLSTFSTEYFIRLYEDKITVLYRSN